jgi:hypothetical protein
MYKKSFKYLKYLASLSLVFFCGCNLNLGQSSSSTPAPAAPTVSYSPIPFPSTFVRSTSSITINLSKTVASLNDEILRNLMNLFEESATALDSRITLVQQNSYNSNVVLDFSQFNIPATLSSSLLSFGQINIGTIQDNDLNVCGGSICQSAYFKFYTTGENGGGFWNNTAQESAPIYINTQSVGNGSSNGTVVQEQGISLTTTSLSNSNLVIPPQYSMQVDFTNLPTGSYQTTLMLEYGLSPNPVDISSLPTIVLTSFNGGQIVAGGSQQTITWSATDSNFYYQPIQIEYSQDAGTTWNSIVQETQNTGSFLWTVPSIDSSQVILRLSAFDVDSNISITQSLNPFIVDSTPPQLALTGINQGEVVAGQGVIPINWTATDLNFGPNPIQLDYSLDGGNSWNSIIQATGNSSPYFWSIPEVNSLTTEVRVTATDLAGNVSQAISSVFTIDSSPPVVILGSLNSGIIAGGSVATLSWTATSPVFSTAPINLQYSINNGTSWLNIATSIANSGTYSWNVPLVNSSTAKIKITANDLAGHSTSVISSSTFIIDSISPVVALTSLNGTSDQLFIRANTTQAITWTATDANLGATPITIDYSTTSGSSWVNIVTGIANSGSYSWSVPGLQTGTAMVRVSAIDEVGHVTTAVSAQTFVITEGFPNTMTIVSGNQQNVPRLVTTQLPLIISISDSFGFQVPAGVTVTYSVLSGGGSVTASVTTNINGQAQAFYTSGSTLGSASVQASAIRSDSTTTTQNFTVNVLSYAPTVVSDTVSGITEYAQFNSSLVGITPTGTGQTANTTSIPALSSAVGFSSSVLTQTAVNIPNASAVAGVGSSGNLSSGTDVLSVDLTATFPSGVSGGSCSVASDSIPALQGLSCSLSGTTSVSFLRNQIDNGVLDLDVLSAGVGSLDFLGISPTIALKRDSIKPVSNTNPSASDGITLKPVSFVGSLYFPANNSNGVSKLYSYNPTTGVMTQISNIKNDQTQADNITSIATYNGSLFFVAELTTGVNKLFKYSTAGVLSQASNIAGTGVSDNVGALLVYNTNLYFSATSSQKLYGYCEMGAGCIPVGISQISNINAGQVDDIGAMIAYNGLLYFSADAGTYSKLFTYCDGTGCGTQGIVQLTNTSTTDDCPNNFIVYDGILYFSEQTSSGVNKLFSFNSSTTTLNQVSNINSSGSDGIAGVTTFGGNLVFIANQSTSVAKLYKYSDQTTLITQLSNLNSSGSDLINNSFATYNNSLYFTGSDSSGFNKMYRLNGTTIYQIANMINSSSDQEGLFLNVGSLLYFSGFTSGTVSKLYQYCEPSTGCSP